MHEQLKPALQQSHAQNLREDAVRRRSRSPHPYHRQQSELAYGSENFSSNGPKIQSPLRSAQATDDEHDILSRRSSVGYKESTNSDSGTEADDEHFLKGLPAPRLRPHKGLRGAGGALSGSPSPLVSPAILEEDLSRRQGFLREPYTHTPALSPDDILKADEKLRRKRGIEIARRSIEAAILLFLAGLLCLNGEVRKVLHFWRAELTAQFLITTTLIAIYPLRLLRHLRPSDFWVRPLTLAIPSSFDPAPLLYPPSIMMLVSLLLNMKNPPNFFPSIILAISALPRHLIPSTGDTGGSYITHWFLSCLPLFLGNAGKLSPQIGSADTLNVALNSEVLLLLYPLHQALCVTLHFLTTTSLLEAELQLLSVSLIDLLLLAASPQAIILKVLLWGGGLGLLVTCSNVLRWGVALARVPKWRFKRERNSAKHWNKRAVNTANGSFGNPKESVFAKDALGTDSSDEETNDQAADPKILRIDTRKTFSGPDKSAENGPASAVEPKSKINFLRLAPRMGAKQSLTMSRRHTLPILSNLPQKSSKRTPSGRRKRTSSSSVQAFFYLTQAQATRRKWIYAGHVYICVFTIILTVIREYVARFALYGQEPVGWALGYLFGDVPWFRMQVVVANLQRWICLPSRSGLEHEESCYLGWVEHLRHASFGEANTRLILCAYWLAIIIVGLAIVFQLSAVYEVDTRRKVFHFMMVAMLLPATYVDPTFAALALSLMLAIFLLLDLFRASQLPPLSKSLAYFLTPYVDGRDLKGPVVISHIFLLIGCAIPLWLSLGTLPRAGKDCLEGWEVPTREVSMVSGVICVGLGDAAASLIGRRYGRRKWLWGGGKSIEGSVAFATAVGLALVLSKAWLRIGGWPSNNDDEWYVTLGKAGVAAWVASLTEAVLTGGNDNVVVPVILWLCVKGLDI